MAYKINQFGALKNNVLAHYSIDIRIFKLSFREKAI